MRWQARVLEPELMEDVDQARAYAAADFSAGDAAFVEALLAFTGPTLGSVVDLGCGPGNISLRLAEALPGTAITGVDGSAAMLGLARAASPADARIRWQQALIGRDPIAGGPFEAVVSNSLLHHLPDPGVLWRAVLALGAPGARVFVGDLRRPPTPAAVEALVATNAADAPAVLREDFRASLHAAFRPEEVRAQLVAAGLDGFTVAAIGDRHLQVRGRLPG